MQREPRKLWRVMEVVLGLVLAGIGLALVRHQLIVNFQAYDDEGCMLLSLDHYLRDGALYTRTHSLYGPFYFYMQQFFHWLFQLPVDHDSGRILTLSYFWISSLLGGFFVWRITRSILLGSSAVLALCILSCKLTDEPGHPQEVLLILLFVGCALITQAALKPSPAVLFLLGGLGAAISLVKVNVGVFYTVALAHTLTCCRKPGRQRTFAIGSTLLYAAVAPLVLMRAHFATWAGWYCILAVVCGVVIFVHGARIRTDTYLSLSQLRYADAGFILVAAAILGAALLQGVSASALYDGIILTPSGHPRLFWSPWRLGPPAMLWAVVLCLAGAAAVRFRARLKPYAEWFDAGLCIVGAAVILVMTFHPKRLGWILPLLPMLLLRVRTTPWSLRDLLPRLFLIDQAATQFLQPYPVASSQAHVAAVPALLWGFVAMHDGFPALTTVAARWAPMLGPPQRYYTAMREMSAVALGVVLIAGALLYQGLSLTTAYPSLDLPGARDIRMEPARAARFRWLAATLNKNCDTLSDPAQHGFPEFLVGSAYSQWNEPSRVGESLQP